MTKETDIRDSNLRREARVRIMLDQYRGNQTPDWIEYIAKSEIPIDHREVQRIRQEWINVHGRPGRSS